jgi:hypothetical protein
MLHIGNEIHRVMLERGRTVVWMARQYGCSRIHMYRIFEKPSIDTAMLLRFSRMLDYDFFRLFSNELEQTSLPRS